MGPRVTKGCMAPIARMTSSTNRMGPVTTARPRRTRGSVLMAFRLSRLKGAVRVTARPRRMRGSIRVTARLRRLMDTAKEIVRPLHHVHMTMPTATGPHPRIRRHRTCPHRGRMIVGGPKTARPLHRRRIRPPTGGLRHRILLRRTRLSRHIRPLRRPTAARRPKTVGARLRARAIALRRPRRKAGGPRTARPLLRPREGVRAIALRRPRPRTDAAPMDWTAATPRMTMNMTARTTVTVPMTASSALIAAPRTVPPLIRAVPVPVVPVRRGRMRTSRVTTARDPTSPATITATAIPPSTTRTPIITSIAVLPRSRTSSTLRT